jgi:NAD(P)-dependent dehydrogenase (short-subunit alcohol dehydrogenase family)
MPRDLSATFSQIRDKFPAPTFSIRTALFNVGQGIWGPFLSITPEQVQETLDMTVMGAFAFAREVVLKFKENDLSTAADVGVGEGKRGMLIFTRATASIRGNVTTSASAAAKHGVRALSQSLAKEFGKDGIHVRFLSISSFSLCLLFFVLTQVAHVSEYNKS